MPLGKPYCRPRALGVWAAKALEKAWEMLWRFQVWKFPRGRTYSSHNVHPPSLTCTQVGHPSPGWSLGGAGVGVGVKGADGPSLRRSTESSWVEASPNPRRTHLCASQAEGRGRGTGYGHRAALAVWFTSPPPFVKQSKAGGPLVGHWRVPGGLLVGQNSVSRVRLHEGTQWRGRSLPCVRPYCT